MCDRTKREEQRFSVRSMLGLERSAQQPAMAAPGGGDTDPPPPISDEDAFKRLIASGGKCKASLSVPKFIKKLEEIP